MAKITPDLAKSDKPYQTLSDKTFLQNTEKSTERKIMFHLIDYTIPYIYTTYFLFRLTRLYA